MNKRNLEIDFHWRAAMACQYWLSSLPFLPKINSRISFQSHFLFFFFWCESVTNPSCQLWLTQSFKSYMRSNDLFKHSVSKNALRHPWLVRMKNHATDKSRNIIHKIQARIQIQNIQRKKVAVMASDFFRFEIVKVKYGRARESKVYKSISKWQFLLLFGLPLFPLMLIFSPSAVFFLSSPMLIDWTLATVVHKRERKKAIPHEYLMVVLNVDDTHILIWSLSSHITSH